MKKKPLEENVFTVYISDSGNYRVYFGEQKGVIKNHISIGTLVEEINKLELIDI